MILIRRSVLWFPANMRNAPLLSPWPGPFGGVPPFDKIKTKDFTAALEAGMEQARREIAVIANTKEPPTFDNTIAALEANGRALNRVLSVFGTYTATMNDKRMQAIETAVAPKLAAFSDEITQNAALFARVAAVYKGRAKAKLTPEQLRLVETHYTSFARRGAALGKADKKKLAAINQQLATLFTKFSQNQLADEEQQYIALTHEAELEGLPDSLRAAMKATAAARGKKKQWLVANTRSSAEPFLVYSTRRDLRERVWRMWVSRGEHKGKHDNRPIIAKLLALRARRAKLLGYRSHAHWIIDDNMARTPKAAMALMRSVWTAAVGRVAEEVADMERIAGHAIEPWDYRHYAEKVRKATYDLDEDEVKNYLQLHHMRDAMFWTAQQLYGLVFTPTSGIPVYHPDVTVYEVTRDGAHVGLWYFDPYARDGKRSGAWMSEYRTQERFAGAVTPIVSNNANFVQGTAGQPILISWDDAVTLFHEFGHALHGLLSNVTYPTLAGTNTKRDFVEFPSQLNEHWLTTPEVLERFCLHHETGKPIPKELVAKIEKAKNFNQGFRTVEYLMAAIYDLEIHQVPGGKVDPIAFEKRILTKIMAPRQIVMRHRPPAFGHIFSDDGYSAGYYSYIWADTLTADASEAFREAGSYYDRRVATALRESIMSVGNAVPPEAAFRTFRGRDVDTQALMRDRGFAR
jgi:peptidyl-dipeptidase Dcp